jgi:hypothetical protein
LSRNSRNRDTYGAKMKVTSKGDPQEMLRLMLASPFRAHNKRLQRIVKLAEAINTVRSKGEDDVQA